MLLLLTQQDNEDVRPQGSWSRFPITFLSLKARGSMKASLSKIVLSDSSEKRVRSQLGLQSMNSTSLVNWSTFGVRLNFWLTNLM